MDDKEKQLIVKLADRANWTDDFLNSLVNERAFKTDGFTDSLMNSLAALGLQDDFTSALIARGLVGKLGSQAGEIRVTTENGIIKPIGKSKPPKLKPISATELNALEIPDIRWITKGLIPEGVALLSAPPKSYKSFMMLDLCIEVCKGGSFMNHECNKSHVLYLDLESGKRRPRDRLKKILNGELPPEGLYILTGEDDVRRIGQGFEDQITELLNHDAELRLIIIDVLKMIRPEAKRGQLSYDADYELIKPLSDIAKSFPGLCIVAVTHDRKMKDVSDWTNNLSGSTGLTGAVDVIMRIDKDKRDSEESTLLITGRDVEPQALQMKFDKYSMRWQCLGTRESINKKRFRNDYSNNPIIQTIKKGLEMENGTYCTTASDMVTASVFWGCAIHDTPRKITSEIERYKTMLSHDGITFKRSRTGGKRIYTFTQTTIDELMGGWDELTENE